MDNNYQLFKMPSLGIDSSDFMNRDSNNEPTAFYGSMFRFAHDTDAKSKAERVGAIKAQNESNAQKPLDNALIDEAKKLGQPVPHPDRASEEEQKAAEAVLAEKKEVEGPKVYSIEELQAMDRSECIKVAAALGVANTNLPKPKLIAAILDKQS